MKPLISETEIKHFLDDWGKKLLQISKAYNQGQAYQGLAEELIDTLYNYQEGPVLFKPTLASKVLFRPTREGALSYFIAHNEKFPEDLGFALRPWQSIRFDIHGSFCEGNQAMVMGNKVIFDENNTETIANFTMGLKHDKAGQLKIILHHSSLPHQP